MMSDIGAFAKCCAEFNWMSWSILGEPSGYSNPTDDDLDYGLRLTLGREPTDEERAEFVSCYRAAIRELEQQ